MNLLAVTLKTTTPNFYGIVDRSLHLAGQMAKRLVYTGREKLSEGDEVSEEMDADEKAETEPVTYKWIQVIAIHDEVAYIITYTSLTDSPDVYIEMFDKMIDNCKIG